VLTLTEQVTLLPGESRTVTLPVTTRASEKWTLDYTSTGEWENVIDLTKDSWIAERRDFDILVRKEGLPTIVEENYRLPVSTEVSRFGEILHANITIDELRVKPFVKEYVTEYETIFEKTCVINLINLSVNGDKLYLTAKSEELRYRSDKQLFSVKLFKSRDPQETQINRTTFIETGQEIHFWYRIR
jgi:hypothetical protein